MGCYDHRAHAGNAGDVWKHFLLLEAADCLLVSGGRLVYVESHAGRPEYVLRAPGEWEGGIGKILPLLPSLRGFCYFDILADLNRISGPILYPGSTRLICELAGRRQASLQADVWDDDAGVANDWESLSTKTTGPFPSNRILFHRGDGFAGVMSILSGSPPGLLFIDPPYIDPEDVRLAEKLLQRAKDMGWIVLLWYMMDMHTAPDDLQTFKLQFSEAGMDGGRWRGAAVALESAKNERFDKLISYMHRRIEAFIRILKLE